MNNRADLSETATARHDRIASPRAVAGVGRVIVWTGGSLWIGRQVGRVPAHAHHAIQISLALEGRFRIRGDAWPEWRDIVAVVVQPDRRHELDGCGAPIATIFVEPNSMQGVALRTRFDGHDVAVLDAAECERAVAAVRAHYAAGATDASLAQCARGAICTIAGDPARAPASDARITAALAWMRGRLTTPLRLEDVAAAVHLSPGRFRHLFVAQTGTSFRAWLMWARAEAAVEAATHGMSWTEAALHAGFADAAHFTRTCRRVFGIAPSMLVFEKSGAPPSI
ncbi:helix-turn-helix transcriptional regulator [Lysobacter xanthus]